MAIPALIPNHLLHPEQTMPHPNSQALVDWAEWTKLVKLTASPSLSYSLSDDVLRMVFDEAAHAWEWDQPPIGLKIIAVCKRWRNVGMQTPSLWADVLSTLEPELPKTHALAWLSSCRGLLRISTVHFRDRDCAEARLRKYCEDKIMLGHIKEFITLGQHLPAFGLLQEMQNLSSLHLTDVSDQDVQKIPALPKLQFLKLDGATLNAACNLITKLEGVREISLVAIFHNMEASMGTTPINAPQLHRISLEAPLLFTPFFEGFHHDTPINSLRIFHLPRPPKAKPQLPQYMNTGLRELSVSHDKDLMVEIINQAPNLQRLEVLGYDDEEYHWLLSQIHNNISFLPQLLELEVDNIWNEKMVTEVLIKRACMRFIYRRYDFFSPRSGFYPLVNDCGGRLQVWSSIVQPPVWGDGVVGSPDYSWSCT